MGALNYRIKDNNWDYFKEIHFFFESFYFYADEINQIIEREISLAKDTFDKFKKETEINPTWEHEWFDYFANVQAKIGLMDIYYDSLIMMLYSFLEKKMYFLSSYLSQKQELKVNDITGNGIFKYKIYLSKVCGIDFSKINDEWKIIIGFNKLRNQIVHSEGIREISKTNQELIKFMKTINGVELKEEGGKVSYHFLTDEILKIFVVNVRIIVDYLYSEEVKSTN